MLTKPSGLKRRTPWWLLLLLLLVIFLLSTEEVDGKSLPWRNVPTPPELRFVAQSATRHTVALRVAAILVRTIGDDDWACGC